MASIQITRNILNDSSILLETRLVKEDGYICFITTSRYMAFEESAYIEQQCNFGELCNYDLEHMKPVIIGAVNRLRTSDNAHQSVAIPVTKRELAKPHQSCKMNQNYGTFLELGENGVSQSEVLKKLSAVDKDSEKMKVFEENKCSVCLNNYKEILDEDLHIIVPSCGHPLCCKCADNILYSQKKECPQCREILTLDSFNLIKFNNDLRFDRQNQRLFL